MIEIKDALEAVHIMTHDDVHVNWAPGDATLYRALVSYTVNYGTFDALTREHDLTLLLVTLAGTNTAALVMSQPLGGHDRWSAEVFLRQFGSEFAGWWAGVRPLLAALGWTAAGCDSLNYDANDAYVIGQLLGTETS